MAVPAAEGFPAQSLQEASSAAALQSEDSRRQPHLALLMPLRYVYSIKRVCTDCWQGYTDLFCPVDGGMYRIYDYQYLGTKGASESGSACL